ncbi:golgin subfamily A member 4-like [Lineus longissimus]|uniref:golgin subfamily A member 4-like n=1 Tax=Lineus longissimus TaxID=88925 RepID=UPI00315D50A9
MGIPDFSRVFDVLDPSCRGYLTADNIQSFHETLHFTPITKDQVNSAISQICGKSSEGRVHKEFFIKVLQDLDRRKNLEQKVRWDFVALDKNGNHRLPLQDALLLFRETHGERFSLHTWQTFLRSRVEPDADVCFDEVKIWLCNLPSGDVCSANELEIEEERLEKGRQDKEFGIYQDFKKLQDDTDDHIKTAKECQDYEDRTKREAQQKLQRWQLGGVEALINDDGRELDDSLEPKQLHDSVSVNELLDALEHKYDLLRHKLFQEMIQKHIGMTIEVEIDHDYIAISLVSRFHIVITLVTKFTLKIVNLCNFINLILTSMGTFFPAKRRPSYIALGETLWQSLNGRDQLDRFQQVIMQEKKMRKDHVLTDEATDLFGAEVMYDASLWKLMGEIVEVHERRLDEAKQTAVLLKAEGKSEEEIDDVLKQQYLALMKGKRSAEELIIEIHNRHQEEKDMLSSQLKMHKVSGIDMMAKFCHLKREHALAAEEYQFSVSALAVGLVERHQQLNSKRFDYDRDRQLKIAETRLNERKGHKMKFKNDSHDGAIKKHQGVVDLQVAVTLEITKKHAFEREVMVQFLQGRDSQNAKAAGRRMSANDREHQVKILRNQHTAWRESDPNYRKKNQSSHRRVIQEGVCMYYEEMRLEMVTRGLGTSDDAVNAAVLADLQQKQEQEFEHTVYEMSNMIPKELHHLRAEEARATTEEFVDNIASLVLGSFECSEEEKMYMVALDNKYDALREKLYVHALRKEKGLEVWESYSIEEKMRLIVKKKMEDRRLHQEGKYEDMGRLMGSSAKTLPTVYSLIGENRHECERRKAVLVDQEQKMAMIGQTMNWKTQDEVPDDEMRSLNHLGDLQIRYDMEQDYIIRWLRSPEAMHLSVPEQEVILIRLQLEWRQAEHEEDFEQAALSVGLLERILDINDKRSKTDERRQYQLAKLRDDHVRSRENAGKPYEKQYDDPSFPPQEDYLAWMELVIIEAQKKHMDERELMLGILHDASLMEVVEVAKVMPVEERQKRLVELQVKKRNLNLTKLSHQDENITILEEAAAIRLISKQEVMKARMGRQISLEEITVYLLTDLQDEQDKQMALLLQKIGKMSPEELMESRSEEAQLRKTEASECAMMVLSHYEGVAQDDELIKALDDKYDAMRDKLLMELLMKQMGEADWNRLSEKEKQRRLMMLKLEQKRLAREGKWDELSRLLGDNQAMDENLRKLMGDSRADYERKLREKLARRKKRIAEGLDPDSDDEGIDEEDEESQSSLVDLEKRYEEERNALMAKLKGFDNHVLGERERQRELMRLKLERRKASQEDNFNAAAMLIGLSERQEAENNARLKNDRQRQEMLAKQRLEMLRNKRSQKVKDDDRNIIITNGDRDAFQDGALALVEKKQLKEREQFSLFLDDIKHGEVENWAMVSSPMERQDRLMELKEQRVHMPIDKTKDQHDLLMQGTAVKRAGRKITLSRPGEDASIEAVLISLMADLQEKQEEDMENVMNKILDMSTDEMIELQKTIVQDMKIARIENVAVALFSPEEGKKAGEKELMSALEGKYDALRDKLLMEALIQQLGESNWKRLSEKERQQKLLEFKLKERQLRKEGRMDEVAAMMGDYLKDKEALERLLGDSKAEQERKMKERLEKRKFRKEQGLSDADCDRLEQQDIATEEAESKQKRRNILLDLETRLDDEKAALLRSLQGFDDSLADEKSRQAYLTKLRLEQRKALQEDKFDAAALVLSLGEQEKDMLDSRRRQEQLARDRLAKKLQEMKDRKGKLAAITEVALPEDENDLVAMQEAVIAEMERKHNEERDVLVQLMHEGHNKKMFADLCHASEQIRQEKIVELAAFRQQWREDGAIQPKEQMEILQEAIMYQLASRLSQLKAKGDAVDDDALFVALLADLQEKQEVESKMMMKDFLQKTPQTLKQLKNVQNLARKNAWYENVAVVVLQSEAGSQAGQDENAQVIDAVEKKYDALRDKILMEALMKQAGDVEWNQLSEKERQARLIKLKMEEKRLRQEGRMDEASELIAGMLENENELNKLLGDTKEQQRKKLEERLARRKQLVAEREAEGLSTDETILDAIQDQEEKVEEKTKKRNILEQLEYHLEDEKAALLAGLNRQGSAIEMERQRQKEIARLKQEERRMKQEDKYMSAVMLIQVHEEQEKKLEATLVADRERQRALAKERLAARKQKKVQGEQDQKLIEEKLRLQQVENEFLDMLLAADAQTEGVAALQQALLEEVDKKHKQERDTMVEIMNAAEADVNNVEQVKSKQPGELKMTLEKLRQERVKWKSKSKQNASKSKEEKMSDKAAAAQRKNLAKSRVEQFKLLTKAMVYRIEAERQNVQLRTPKADTAALNEEISVAMMTDLQSKQDTENKVLTKIMVEQDADTLTTMRDQQRQGTNEGWMDNVVNAIFRMLEDGDEVALPDVEAERKVLEDELKRERDEAVEKRRKAARPGEKIDPAAVMQELEAQQALRRQALEESFEKQRSLAKAKLEARRHARDEKEYEEMAAAEFLKMGERTETLIREKTFEERSKHQNVMQQRLKERKRNRRRAADSERQRQAEEEEVDAMDIDVTPRDAPPMMAMRREKTIIDVNVTEEESKAIYEKMLREQTIFDKKKLQDKTRQEEIIQRKLQEKKDKRQSEAATIFSKGEKDKLYLEKTQASERERQMTMIKERVARVRFERTMTMRQKSNQTSAQFETLLQDSSSLSEDEKMALAAKRMQDKFKTDEGEMKAGRMKLMPDLDEELVREEDESSGSSRRQSQPQDRILGDKEKLSILKQRRLEKKKKR